MLLWVRKLPGPSSEKAITWGFRKNIYEQVNTIQRRLRTWRNGPKGGTASMMTHMIALASLALLCGLAWHNRPAREPIRLAEPGTKRDGGRRPKR